MKHIFARKTLPAMILVLAILMGLFLSPSAFAEKSPSSYEPAISVRNWDLEEVDSFIENASVYAEYKAGTIYENDFAFVYIPKSTPKLMNYGFLFPGNNYGFAAPVQCIESVCEYYYPRSVFVYVKESGLATLNKEDGVLFRCGEILKSISKDTGVIPHNVGVVGYSNGGYTALHVAAYLIDEFNLNIPKVTILDMGQQWRKREFLITEEQAKPMLEAGTEIYHFTRGGETAGNNRVQEFMENGIPLYEVACKCGASHGEILSYAFAYETIFWAVGDYNSLDKKIYDQPVLVNPDKVA